LFYCRDVADVVFIRTACGHYPLTKPAASDPYLASPAAINRFMQDPQNPVFVSFPRTGSHWLSMMLELYFERPRLTRTSLYPGRDDYFLLHWHDVKLNLKRQNVIYQYRDPVDTIFSQLMYDKDNIDDRSRIAHWADLYGQHLDKWLYQERFTTHKTVLFYDTMRQDTVSEVTKAIEHFAVPVNHERLQFVVEHFSSKHAVKRHVTGNDQVINRMPNYENLRQGFRSGHTDFVWRVLLKGRSHLANSFPDRCQV
jgi:hypothetical protein